jgi:glutaredoxin
MFLARPLLALALVGVLAAAGLSRNDANAQQIYRFTGPDGRITFSDKPPLDPNLKTTTGRTVQLPGEAMAGLPFEVRQAASKYPVTFYTGPGCGPCISGRELLTTRGIPFTEKTVTSNEDIEALKRLAGAAALPFLTVGGQPIRGYSEVEWVQFLDAAGYPKTSQLPPSYTQAAPTPLVAAQEPLKPTQPQSAQRTPADGERGATPAAPLEAPADNPSGIRF